MNSNELAQLQILLDKYTQEVKGGVNKTAFDIIMDIDCKVFHNCPDVCIVPSCSREGEYRLKQDPNAMVCGMHAYVNPNGNDGIECKHQCITIHKDRTHTCDTCNKVLSAEDELCMIDGVPVK